MAVDQSVVQALMKKHAEKYANAKGNNRWRPTPGTYSVLFVELDEGTFQGKDGEPVLRWAPMYEILEGAFKGKRFLSNAMFTSNEGSLADMHVVVETLYGRTIAPPNMEQDRQMLLDARNKVVATVEVNDRKGDKGTFADDKIVAATMQS